MFTGLVEGCGRVAELVQEPTGLRLRISVPAEMRAGDSQHPATHLGDSVAINGCCLTVVAIDEAVWDFQAGTETLSRTNLGRLQAGDPVNLERALAANARVGGHFVQGHVDGQGTVAAIEPDGEWISMWFAAPRELTRYMVVKGSITIDGISLTLVDVEPERFSVALIPHTLEKTTLSVRQVGDWVNLETDVIAKYVEKMLTPWQRG